MKFSQTPLEGAYTISLEKLEDERGFFGRVFCVKELEFIEPNIQLIQANDSFSKKKGTMRGLHYQFSPYAEIKIVRCIKGALFDVIVDLRESSQSFMKYFGIELTGENRQMIYVPRGFAHGFLTLEDNTEALYLSSAPYSPKHERGLRWNDSAIKIRWPFDPIVVSEKDLVHPNFSHEYHLDRQMVE